MRLLAIPASSELRLMAAMPRFVMPSLAWVLMLGALPSLPAGAADSRPATATESVPEQGRKKPGKQASGSRSVVLPGGSGESPSARSARLKRECKGRPNAGACTGYTD